MLIRLVGASITTWVALAGLVLGAHSVAGQSGDRTQLPARETIFALQPYTGVYRLDGNRRVGIDRFISDNGDSTLLFCDYETGLVRPLFRISPTEFAMGPSFAVRSPVELIVQFQMDGQDAAQGLTMRPTGGAAAFAAREASRDEEVVFRHRDTTLAGTLIAPATPGPHPAIVLLHGSGPLTRHSFGPWPRFFNSLGMAVLVYDKRGTGASTGVRLDASTGAPATLSKRHYPDDLTDDALAALRFLQGRAEVDRKQIGFWGSSEGGMLATQVAARSKEVAPLPSTLRASWGRSGRRCSIKQERLRREGALRNSTLTRPSPSPGDVPSAVEIQRRLG